MRTLVLMPETLVYRSIPLRGAGAVTYVPNVSWVYLTPDAVRSAPTPGVPVPFFVQERMRIAVGTADEMTALAARQPGTPRTTRSAYTMAARAAAREGLDGVAVSDDGAPVVRVFLLSPGRRLRRVEEAYQGPIPSR